MRRTHLRPPTDSSPKISRRVPQRRAAIRLALPAGPAILILGYLILGCLPRPTPVWGQIARPDDAPPALSTDESRATFQLPAGFRMELIAAEPLLREPSGVCWDERGQLFVSELHGYNLEGQYDIEELNRGGELDRVVRRVQADERHKQAAAAETYGTIRRLVDSDNDGRIDRAGLWADRLPPCLGICPARGGIIAACQTEIWFLADRDQDGTAEVRELLFAGFQEGPLERSINCPQWGPDNWIYFGRGAGGGTIRGKYLAQAVELPGTDFRIQPDGTAIEPVTGSTATMGFAFTEAGDRFTISTRTPGIFVAPLPWHYLARNPDVAATSLQEAATADQRVYPTSRPHPWRTRRAEDPGFAKYYSDRYGIEESAPNGYFTSACSPLVYQDTALPGLRGQLLACEPAQNLVHRALIRRDGARLMLHRPSDEARSEFLTAADPWFHAIALSHAPDGSVYVVDFYREIIEDYSAIPRYLQQLYGLVAGREHGRLWRLTHDDKLTTPAADMSGLGPDQLAAEVASPHHWRRTTARRLILEAGLRAAVPELARVIREASEPVAVINALQTLDGLGLLDPIPVARSLEHADAGVRRQALRFAERWLDAAPEDAAFAEEARAAIGRIRELAYLSPEGLVTDPEPMVRLQLALSLGESNDPQALRTLARLARDHGGEPWMSLAILTAVPGRGAAILAELLATPEEMSAASLLLEPLCQAIASRRDAEELSAAISRIGSASDDATRTSCLRGLRAGLKGEVEVAISAAARQTVRQLAQSADDAVRAEAWPLITRLNLESAAERSERLAVATTTLADVQASADQRLAALAQLSDSNEPAITGVLIETLATSTPKLREAILAAILGRSDRLPSLLDAVEARVIAPATLTAVQRETLLRSNRAEIRDRATQLLDLSTSSSGPVLARYVEGLKLPRDVAHGEQVFRLKCANCHQAHGLGHAVGPDLSAEFQRAEETILRDVVAPSDNISAGYGTYTVATTSGQVYTGLLATETPTSLTLRQAEGKQETILRKDLELLRAMSVSLMPEDLIQSVSPQDLADLLAWIRRPPTSVLLIDENLALAEALNEGAGTAEFLAGDAYRGDVALRVTPPQRYSARIAGWEYRIRENPGPGEYRYLRFAWKTPAAAGVMIELATDGRWPAADAPRWRYHSGKNTTAWQSTPIDESAPRQWAVVIRDLWREFGDFTLTGIAPTPLGAPALFDAFELLREVDEP